MSLESQLNSEISNCSHCILGSSKVFCTPLFSPHCDTILLFASPDNHACREASPWEHTAAKYLRKIIHHAFGTDLSRFHISFLTKCHLSTENASININKRRECAEICSSHYLNYELKAVNPKQIIAFGEIVAQLCFPNHSFKESDKQNKTLNLQPYNIPTHLFDNPLALPSKGGISSKEGLRWTERLHDILGGDLHPPQVEEEQALFDLL